MVWGKTSDRDEHGARSKALTAAYEGPRGIPDVSDAQAGLGQTGRRAAKDGRAGSRGGAPIWVLHGEGFGLMPERLSEHEASADPDGYAVFGRFPKGMLSNVVRLRLLGPVKRDEILHVCSGTLTERWTVDIRPQARPRVIADGKALPFRDASFPAVLLDPPYSDQYARNLYGVENPRPSWLLREAARVVRPEGRIGILHVALPFAPPGCRLLRVWPVSTGVGFRIRALTVYERTQRGLEL